MARRTTRGRRELEESGKNLEGSLSLRGGLNLGGELLLALGPPVGVDSHKLDVLVLLDLVPRAPVRVPVPDDLRALGETVEVEASTGNSSGDNARN